jgi:hypothetical protein
MSTIAAFSKTYTPQDTITHLNVQQLYHILSVVHQHKENQGYFQILQACSNLFNNYMTKKQCDTTKLSFQKEYPNTKWVDVMNRMDECKLLTNQIADPKLHEGITPTKVMLFGDFSAANYIATRDTKYLDHCVFIMNLPFSKFLHVGGKSVYETPEECPKIAKIIEIAKLSLAQMVSCLGDGYYEQILSSKWNRGASNEWKEDLSYCLVPQFKSKTYTVKLFLLSRAHESEEWSKESKLPEKETNSTWHECNTNI